MIRLDRVVMEIIVAEIDENGEKVNEARAGQGAFYPTSLDAIPEQIRAAVKEYIAQQGGTPTTPGPPKAKRTRPKR